MNSTTNISFNKYIYDAIINNWDADALTDYQGSTLQFHDVARKIEKLHITILKIPKIKRIKERIASIIISFLS